MKKLLFLLLFLPFLGNSQATFTAPVGYNTGAPTATPSGVGTRWRFDLLTGKKYTWLPGTLSWDEDARGIDQVAGCSAPLYTPGYNQSTFAVNSCTVPELYHWTGAAWVQLNEGAVYTAGTGISIDGSNVISNTAPNVVQELSISGQDLTLSGGGGTVAIPAGASDALGTGFVDGGGNGVIPGTTSATLEEFGTFSIKYFNGVEGIKVSDDEDITSIQTSTGAAALTASGSQISIYSTAASFAFSPTVMTITDFRATEVGLEYAAYYPDIETNDPSLTSTQNVNSLKQKLVTYTTTQRNAIPTPATGYVIYNTDATATDGSTGCMQIFNGSTWKNAW